MLNEIIIALATTNLLRGSPYISLEKLKKAKVNNLLSFLFIMLWLLILSMYLTEVMMAQLRKTV